MAAGMEYVIYLSPIIKEIRKVIVKQESQKPKVFKSTKKGGTNKDWER